MARVPSQRPIRPDSKAARADLRRPEPIERVAQAASVRNNDIVITPSRPTPTPRGAAMPELNRRDPPAEANDLRKTMLKPAFYDQPGSVAKTGNGGASRVPPPPS